jgi:L-alanine-DL-glutamate epimerase-like enolase superfamily enzyme
MKPDVPIETVRAQAFRIPTDRPEADGTMSWNSTTLVLVETSGGGNVGIGYTYSSACIVELIRDVLAPAIAGHDAFTPRLQCVQEGRRLQLAESVLRRAPRRSDGDL